MLRRALVESYGCITSDDDSENDKNRFIVASMNLRLTLIDGLASYIVGYPYLYISSVGAVYNDSPSYLLSLNITHIVNCSSNKLKNKHTEHFQYFNLSIEDNESTDIFVNSRLAYEIEHCLEYIHNAVISNSYGSKVLIHCYQGKSRSATIIIAYLIKYHSISYSAALTIVRSSRSIIQPHLHFAKQLQAFSDSIELKEREDV